MSQNEFKLVKFSNDLNKYPFRGLSSTEIDMLLALVSEVRDKETNDVIVSLDELRESIQFKKHGFNVFIEGLVKTNQKLNSLNVTLTEGNVITTFSLFTTFQIDKDARTLKVAVNPTFRSMFNALSEKFTQFNLEDAIKFKSSYAKEMYRQLMQWKSVGNKYYSMDELRYRLSIPETYETRNIKPRIISPIEKELSKVLTDFKIEVKRKGSTILGYRFTFQPITETFKNDVSEDFLSKATYVDNPVQTGELLNINQAQQANGNPTSLSSYWEQMQNDSVFNDNLIVDSPSPVINPEKSADPYIYLFQDRFLKFKSKEEIYDNIDGKQADLLADLANKISPEKMIKIVKQKRNGIVSNDELRLITQMQSLNNDSVINVLIYYVLVVLSNTTIHPNLVHKILDNWAQNSVTTADGALLALQSRYRASQQRQQTQNPDLPNMDYLDRFK